MRTIEIKTSKKNRWNSTINLQGVKVTFDKKGKAIVENISKEYVAHLKKNKKDLAIEILNAGEERETLKEKVERVEEGKNETRKVEKEEVEEIEEETIDEGEPEEGSGEEKTRNEEVETARKLAEYKFDELKELAAESGLPENEWKLLRSKAGLIKYLVDKI